MTYKTSSLLLTILFFLTSCQGQQKETPPPSKQQDIETTPSTDYGKPLKVISLDTSPGWKQGEEKLMVEGIVYNPDGKTPASDISIYYYHTNAGGRYMHKSDIERSLPQNQAGMTHGHLRGWVKTDSLGRYAIYTSKPGSYPSGDEPAHIHFYIKEPDQEDHYYIDDIVFEGDPLLTIDKRNKFRNRGGPGVVTLTEREGILYGERDIIMGLNVEGYGE